MPKLYKLWFQKMLFLSEHIAMILVFLSSAAVYCWDPLMMFIKTTADDYCLWQ